MRDEKDPGTIELPLIKKRGRPAIHTFGAMTPAERARNYRARNRSIWKFNEATITQLTSELARAVTKGYKHTAEAALLELTKRVAAMEYAEE